jgi:hypothetical protein
MANVAVSVVSYVLLFILISGLAGTVEFHEFKKQFKDKLPIMVGFCGQFVLLPFPRLRLGYDIRPDRAREGRRGDGGGQRDDREHDDGAGRRGGGH